MISTAHLPSPTRSAQPVPGPYPASIGLPSAYGYVSVPPVLHPDDGEAALRAWTHDLADAAARTGYTFAGIFADMRGQTETGLYRLLDVLRSGAGVAVLVPDLDHLQHAGCLSGADSRTAARYLRARLLMACDLRTGHGVTPPRTPLDQHSPRGASTRVASAARHHDELTDAGLTSTADADTAAASAVGILQAAVRR